jgi:hypothetical protein
MSLLNSPSPLTIPGYEDEVFRAGGYSNRVWGPTTSYADSPQWLITARGISKCHIDKEL